MITAFVLVSVEAQSIPETAQAIADLDGVDSVSYSKRLIEEGFSVGQD
jgi:hypothetical protein